MESGLLLVLFFVAREMSNDGEVSFVHNYSSKVFWSARPAPPANSGPTSAATPGNCGAAHGHWGHGGTLQRPALPDCWGRPGLYRPHHCRLHPLLFVEGLV